MARQRYRGVSHQHETFGTQAIRDVRPFWQQVRDLILGRIGATGSMLTMVVCMWLFPIISDFSLLIALFIFWFSYWRFKRLPFKLPVYCHKKDPNDPLPGSVAPGEAAGIYFFGNDAITKEQLWFNNSDMRTHVLIFGSTGSGKTEALVSLAYNALVLGSGLIYVDGKGDNSLFAKMFSMVRRMGREDDLLLVNFMTGANDIIGPQEHVLSNTMNPFALGSSSMLSNLVVSLMDGGSGSNPSGGGDGDMWKGRAISFIEALMRPMVWLRDHGYLLLEAGLIRRYFVLDVLEELLYDKKVIDQNGNISVMPDPLPLEVREPLENYLATLPGYERSEKGKQSGKAYEQHGYITMQLTRIFGSLADVNGHIIRTNLAEVDFRDVVINRRILVVLLPALEKSPDELSNLGKLIIASLKSMLAEGLGSRVEGDYRDVIERKPTNSKTPFLCVLDEYGYYAVKGFAVVPAQARSLGFSVIFAGQDLPAFEKASKEEAASICANTNIKICMKLEDPKETWEFFQKTAGETYVAVTRSFNRLGDGTSAFAYRDTMEAQMDKRFRIDLLDLKDQREGEAHIFFKSRTVRAKMFYANPAKVRKLKLNQMLKVKGPAEEVVGLMTKLRTLKIDLDAFTKEGSDDPLKPIFDLIHAPDRGEGLEWLQVVMDFVDGHQAVEEISFGDQADNPSIFMSVPIDQRLASAYFDVAVATLQDSIMTKETLYEVVKKLNIMEGKSAVLAKREAIDMIARLEKETSYASCVPVQESPMGEVLTQLLSMLKAATPTTQKPNQ